jgi:hypothetical protein
VLLKALGSQKLKGCSYRTIFQLAFKSKDITQNRQRNRAMKSIIDPSKAKRRLLSKMWAPKANGIAEMIILVKGENTRLQLKMN